MTETQVKLCGVCGKNEMAESCEVCGIPLCTVCRKRVTFYSPNPASNVKPGVHLSPLRAGILTRKVCPKCMTEHEFYEEEYY